MPVLYPPVGRVPSSLAASDMAQAMSDADSVSPTPTMSEGTAPPAGVDVEKAMSDYEVRLT